MLTSLPSDFPVSVAICRQTVAICCSQQQQHQVQQQQQQQRQL